MPILVSSLRRRLVPVLVAAVASACIAAPAAQAATVSYDLPQSPAQINSYWTPQRMEAARPLDAPPGQGSPLASTASNGSGRAEEIPPSQGSVSYDLEPGSETSFPQRVQGRVFMTIPGEGDASCSGTVVSSRLQNLVFTAGHCVQYPGAGPSTNFIFVPGYRDGSEPFGEYPAASLLAPSQWTQSGDLAYDVGIAEMATPLEQTLGGRGIAFNSSPRTSYQIFGYPGLPNPPYDGERLIECDAPFFGLEAGSHPFSIIASPCVMKQGSSGGGWIDPSGHIVSVVSHGYTDPSQDGQIVGPYFGDAVRALYNQAGGSAECPPAQQALTRAHRQLRRAKRGSQRALRKARQRLSRAQLQHDAVC